MEVNCEEVSAVLRRCTVTVPEDEVASELDRIYSELRRKVRLKGFRPGRAPLQLLRAYYRDYAERELAEKMIERTISEALKNNEIEPVSRPSIEKSERKEGRGFTYTFTVEVKPKLEVAGLDELDVELKPAEITDEDVEKELEYLRDLNARLEVIEEDRPVEKGDHVVVDMTVRHRHAPEKDSRDENVLVEVGKGFVLPEIDEKIVGQRRGDVLNFSLKLPEDFKDAGLAGREAEFEIEIKELKKKVLPELDDGFAKTVGDFESLEDLKAHIKNQLKKRAEMEARDRAREEIMEKLREKNPVDLPTSLVEDEKKMIYRGLKERLKIEKATLGTAEAIETMEKKVEEQARKRVHDWLILDAIAEKEKIDASEEEVDDALRKMAEQRKTTFEHLKKRAEEDGSIRLVRWQIVEDKVLDFILSRAKMKLRGTSEEKKEGGTDDYSDSNRADQ